MVIALPELYTHQERMRDDVRAALAKDRRSILQAPPGTGKTRLAKWMLGSYANMQQREGESGHALFAVHRRGLVENASRSFLEGPILPHGLLMSKRKSDYQQTIQVASIDTLLSWYVDGDKYTGHPWDFIVFDECHAHIGKLRSLLKPHDEKRKQAGLKPAFLLGLSATPQHKELNQVFKSIVKGPSPEWLIGNKFLKPFRYFTCTQGKASVLVKRGDEYTEDSVAAAMTGLAGNMVEDWKRHAAGRATVGFFPRRTHAAEAVELFRAAGVNAVYLDGETPDDERQQIFDDLNEGRIDYIANVGVIERGTDIPRIGCVQMCVFVGSIVRWLQMIGRGSRIHPDVDDCIVLDHGDGVAKRWFFESDVNWTLEWGERPAKTHEAPPMVSCPSCGRAYRGGKCTCGYEPTPKERRSQNLEFVGGELQEIKPKEAKKDDKPQSCESIMIQALYMAGKGGMTFGQAWHIAKAKAAKKGIDFKVPAAVVIAGHRYKIIPHGHPDSKRKVRDTYGVTVGNYMDLANPYRESR